MAASTETAARFEKAEYALEGLGTALTLDLTVAERAVLQAEMATTLAEFNAAYAAMEAEGWY